MAILKTDGGDHTPDKWAMATAQMLAPVDLNGPNARAALDLQGKLADILTPHHKGVQDAERASLAADGDAHLVTPFTPEAPAAAAFADAVAAYAGTPWADKPKDPEWIAAAQQLIATHFATAQFTARSWHCDRPGASPDAVAWKAGFHGVQAPAPEPDPEPAEQAAA